MRPLYLRGCSSFPEATNRLSSSSTRFSSPNFVAAYPEKHWKVRGRVSGLYGSKTESRFVQDRRHVLSLCVKEIYNSHPRGTQGLVPHVVWSGENADMFGSVELGGHKKDDGYFSCRERPCQGNQRDLRGMRLFEILGGIG